MTSQYLAIILGLFLSATGPVLILRTEQLVAAYKDLIENERALHAAAFIEIVAGVIIVSLHNVLTLGYQGVITVIGMLMIIEGVFHFTAPTDTEKHLVDLMTAYRGWTICGVLCTVIGLYLLGAGLL